jgi:hypothetical protein
VTGSLAGLVTTLTPGSSVTSRSAAIPVSRTSRAARAWISARRAIAADLAEASSRGACARLALAAAIASPALLLAFATTTTAAEAKSRLAAPAATTAGRPASTVVVVAGGLVTSLMVTGASSPCPAAIAHEVAAAAIASARALPMTAARPAAPMLRHVQSTGILPREIHCSLALTRRLGL